MGAKDFKDQLQNWGQLTILRELKGGYRNNVVLLKKDSAYLVAKTTRRSQKALEWLELVFPFAREAGFVVPSFIPSLDNEIVHTGVTVERFIEGKPIELEDLPKVNAQLERFHALTRHLPQRPSFASATDLILKNYGGDVDLTVMPQALIQACRKAWQCLIFEPCSVIHGDPNPSNILKTPEGRYALIDWDEARVDASCFDRYGLLKERFDHPAKQAIERAALAWEVAVCWQIEPEHARTQALKLE